MALQKYLGDDCVQSLRDLEPNLPLPRVINGLPAYIKARDRSRIREGDRSTIIFWSSLFSIYRVLKSPYKLKTSTITDPFNGDQQWLTALLTLPSLSVHFDKLPKFRYTVERACLAPMKLLVLRSASPTNLVS